MAWKSAQRSRAVGTVELSMTVFICKQRTQVSWQTALGFRQDGRMFLIPSYKRNRKLPDRCVRIPKVAVSGLLVGYNLHSLHEVRYGIAKFRFLTYSEINIFVS